MKHFLPLIACLLFGSVTIMAQHSSLSGRVYDGDHFIPGATVVLLKVIDSSWVKTEFTGDDGTFSIKNVDTGNYLVNVTMVGYAPAWQPVAVQYKDVALPGIRLQMVTTTMKEVAVTAKKPFIEMALGKVLVNVDGSPSVINSNALDMLRRLPGVSVDQNGNISMQGRQGVQVLINDRPTYLTGEQLAVYLKGMSAAEIAQLELISQPGAKYDATGNTGIINIKLNRNRKSGLNGTTSLTLGQGIYANENSNIMASYNKNRFNLSLNATDLHGQGFADWTDEQQLTDIQTGVLLTTNQVHSTPKEEFSVTTLRLAADYDISDKTTIGASVRGSYHPNQTWNEVFTRKEDYVNNLLSYGKMGTKDGFLRRDITTNAYLSHKFSKEHTLDVNFDYLNYINDQHQDINNTLYNELGQEQGIPLVLRSHQPSYIHVYSAKADHSYTFKNGIKLETGIKSSIVQTDNDAHFDVLQSSLWVNDTTRSNRFVYTENLNALYATAGREINKKWSARLGLRAEQTLANGRQYIHDNSFDRSYISLFPTVFVDYRKDSNNHFELNYGRRIDRPGYQQLNPFIHYSFQYNYYAGNPNLTPMYTQSLKLQHSYKNMIITSLALFRSTDMITDVIISDGKNVYALYKNVADNRSIDASVSFNKDVTRWWTLNLSGNMYYAVNSGIVGTTSVQQKGIGYETEFYSLFTFNNNWKAEAYLFYSGREVNFIMGTIGENIFLSLGASRKIGQHLQVKCALDDPFYKNREYLNNDVPGFKSNVIFRRNSQVASISVSYSFGSGQAREQRQNTVEEKKRMKVD